MALFRLPAHYGRVTDVDHCATCGGLWFDPSESHQLTAGATLTLLDRMAGVTSPAAVKGTLRCVRCRELLREVTDQQRGTRFMYHTCPSQHGRFITAYQFLREKHLVRELSPHEVLQLRASIQQINCVNCGGPVGLAGADACPHCRTPVSTVDPLQLRRELEALRERDEKNGTIDPALPITLAHERARAERAWSEAGEDLTWLQGALQDGGTEGLLGRALRLLATRSR